MDLPPETDAWLDQIILEHGAKIAAKLREQEASAPKPASEAGAAGEDEEMLRRIGNAIYQVVSDEHNFLISQDARMLAARAAIRACGGEDAEVAHAVAHMAAHDRDEALVRAMEAEKLVAELEAALQRGGLDLCPCRKCGQIVAGIPDGLPFCEDCADAEGKRSGETLNTADGEQRIAESVEAVKPAQDELDDCPPRFEETT